MGNLCGKPSSDPFNQPGRRLDSAPPPGQPASSSVPASARPAKSSPAKVGGPPRTLGGGAPSSTSSSADDARRKAAEAAEARLQQSKKGGQLKAQLAKQQGKSRVDTLKDASESERRHRDIDSSVAALRNA
ncbi:hypothetical protein QBC38DRAFT_197643 [Podospora fimiseda]|uniref:Uncharacterized protein n=1 Tax=Podospora fimiseda TaxID=252190 RepID=A0AAN7BPP2_9PEZI|nr:hypothetical protein QBC38DRAFT_197643 [Podospora fimiseda]